jgi:hypothetical protein
MIGDGIMPDWVLITSEFIGLASLIISIVVFITTKNTNSYIREERMLSELSKTNKEFSKKLKIQIDLIVKEDIFDSKIISEITKICTWLEKYSDVLIPKQKRLLRKINRLLKKPKNKKEELVSQLSKLAGLTADKLKNLYEGDN